MFSLILHDDAGLVFVCSAFSSDSITVLSGVVGGPLIHAPLTSCILLLLFLCVHV